tara:strand:+ start:132 stop:716 length:585 start_codon:yes stop_codon:yes gene_type:complete
MNCVIVHGCPSKDRRGEEGYIKDNEKHWILWLRKKLEEKGVEVTAPCMPEPWKPDYGEWKRILDGLNIGRDTILVGHSCGGGFLVRYLGDTKKKVKKLILVAPAIVHSDYGGSMKELLSFEIDSSIKERVEKISIFVSNDTEGILKAVELFSESLDAENIVLEDKKHFCLWDMGTEEFPELLEEIMQETGLEPA